MIDFSNPEMAFAIQAVRQASRLVQQIQQAMVVTSLTKEDRSPVTVADFASQSLVGSLFERHLPHETLVAEEDSSRIRQPEASETLAAITRFVQGSLPQASSEQICTWIDRGTAEPGARFWTLDPIDGTKGFLRGDQYAVALALVENGEVQLGVLGCPKISDGYRPDFNGQGSLVVARRGQGCWTASLENTAPFRQLMVSQTSQAGEARLLRSVESGHTNTGKIEQLVERLSISAEPVRMDSQAKYAVLASGHGDLLVRLLTPSKPDYQEKIWDQAAGSIIIEEAGGQITDLSGRRLDFNQGRTLKNNRGILASNGALHEPALRALSQIGAI